MALLLGYLALLLGHPAHPMETFAQTEPERLESTTVNTYLPLAPWILQNFLCQRLPRFSPQELSKRPTVPDVFSLKGVAQLTTTDRPH